MNCPREKVAKGPRELALVRITTVEPANRFIREVDLNGAPFRSAPGVRARTGT